MGALGHDRVHRPRLLRCPLQVPTEHIGQRIQALSFDANIERLVNLDKWPVPTRL